MDEIRLAEEQQARAEAALVATKARVRQLESQLTSVTTQFTDTNVDAVLGQVDSALEKVDVALGMTNSAITQVEAASLESESPDSTILTAGSVVKAPSLLRASPIGAFKRELSDDELEAIFFQFDTDSGGEIDREELAEALFQVGYRMNRKEYDAIFDAYDQDGGGTIDFDEFKDFIQRTNMKPERSVQFAMNLFRRYDTDNGGSIDKFEFAKLAEEVETNYKRRTFLGGAAILFGAIVVQRKSEEYAWAQKTFRPFYIEKQAEEVQNKFFPTALLSSDFDEAVASTLMKRGYTPANTLFAHSVCSDEVNNKDEELVDLMVNRWREGFSLGGLGGLPFAGRSGFRAYLHHVPDSGKLLILFAPHVGIDAQGRVGALQRDGQNAVSKACGAALGSYKTIQKKAEAEKNGQLFPVSEVRDVANLDNDPFDPQLQIIINLLTPRLKGVEQSAEPITFVTYQMYTIVRDLIDNVIRETDDVWDWATEVAVVGGVMINRRVGGDFFQPLSFKVSKQNTQPLDLFSDAFGSRPDLLPVLGSKEAVQSIFARKAVGKTPRIDASRR